MANIRYNIITAHGWLGTARDSFDEGMVNSFKRARAQLEKARCEIVEAVAALDLLITDKVGQLSLIGMDEDTD
jgi:hypothetical protein